MCNLILKTDLIWDRKKKQLGLELRWAAKNQLMFATET